MKSRRLAIISAAAILAGSAMPALAQDVPDIAESPDIVESHVLPPVPETPGAAPMPVAPAYPADYQRARAEWIDTCVARYRGEKKRDGNGGLIGGLIGAVVGGFAGNRIDDKGSRLAGTLIGAGVGGVAGAALGSLASRSSRPDEDEAYAWCEDYLARSSQQQPSYGYPQPYGYGYPGAYPMQAYPALAGGCCQPAYYPQAYGPVMMVPVMMPGRNCKKKQVVTEEVVEEKIITRHIPAPDKRVKIVPVKTKTLRYSK